MVRDFLHEACGVVFDRAVIVVGIADGRSAVEAREDYARGEVGAGKIGMATVMTFVQMGVRSPTVSPAKSARNPVLRRTGAFGDAAVVGKRAGAGSGPVVGHDLLAELLAEGVGQSTSPLNSVVRYAPEQSSKVDARQESAGTL